MRNRIMLFTVIPAAVILTIAAVIMTFFVSGMINSVFRTGAASRTELTCSRIDICLQEYVSVAERMADESCMENFLKTVDDRDSLQDNAYYSQVLSKLDSVITQRSSFASTTWTASVDKPNILFTNSSCGWTARDDFDVTSRPYYQPFLNIGCSVYISDPYINEIDGKYVISVVSAVRDSRTGRRIGLCGIDIDMDSFNDKLASLSMNEKNEIFIRSGNGLTVYAKDIEKQFADFSNLRLQFIENDGIIGNYRILDTDMIGTSELITDSSWTVYALERTSGIKNVISTYSATTVGLFALIIVMLSILLVIVSGKIAKPLQDYTRCINNIHLDSSDVENDDEDNQFLVPAGCRELEHFAIGFNALIDRNRQIVGQLKEMNIASEKERKLYQTALESSSDVVFEYDIETDVLISYGSIWDKTAPKTLQDETRSFIGSFIQKECFVFTDLNSFRNFFAIAECDEPVRFGYTDDSGTTSWYSCEGTPIFGSENAKTKHKAPVKIVGKFRNIDDLVSLKNVAECDALTGFLNKISTEKHISAYLEKTSSESGLMHAAALIDIDNFKNLNDKLGHAAGDDALVEISSVIRSVLRENDILGRIGGDEFFVFMKKLPDKEAAEKIFRRVCEKIQKTYTSAGGISVTVSASIGVSLCPNHGRDFESLYSAADIAMYITKTKGKNGFTIYDGEERPEYHNSRT
ncbi:MAG: diguanylate cyclase domain-containing protein [Huintestinicola sp.]